MRSHIASSYNYSGDLNGVDADILRDYNLGVESWAHARDKDPKRSIERLPNELLIVIIQKAAWVGYPGYHRELLVLSLVNRRWAGLILRTQYFWNRVYLKDNIEDLEPMTAVILELSGDSPLELTYYAESDVIRKVAHLIRPHLHRITRLEVLQHYGQSDHGTDPFFPHTVFPSLRNILTQHIPPKSIVACLSHHEVLAPYKHLIEGDGFFVELKVTEKNRVSFRSTVTSVANIQRLEDIPTLECVSIYGGYELSRDLSTAVKETRRHLGWKTLFISRFPWKRIRGILGRCTSLISLALMDIDQIAALELTQMIPRLTFLEDISIQFIEVPMSETPVMPVGEDVSHETKIQTMHLRLRPGIPNMTITGDILHLLLRMSPRLESLSLSGYRVNKLDFIEIGKLKELRKIDLFDCESISEPNTTRHMLACPKLETVRISGSIDALDSLASSSASELDYRLEMRASPRIEINGRDWPSLRSLRLFMDSTPIMCGLNSLRHLSLWSQSLVTTTIPYLAMHPSELPVLETLDLHACPEWDILFIMLEKRLLTQTYGIKPIENLIFDRAISTRIKHSLASLLAGHIFPRPSNYELSMQGNLELFLDTNM
ncbi:hypothetical protein PIIN_06439 [Serendipita indica DSM 11827]|uniref:F-box domain-containing protein n=1 Tax=Serendipita indica (strain DSM 11827) TaxID=1109443 RepID=G4TMF9_SERID|nr:hypothetical protein PIIN_06439 [Serendipita indica DSM 11827]